MSDVMLLADEGGDWAALYVGGLLVAEGHSLRPQEVLDGLGIVWTGRSFDMQDDAWPGCPARINPGLLPDEQP